MTGRTNSKNILTVVRCVAAFAVAAILLNLRPAAAQPTGTSFFPLAPDSAAVPGLGVDSDPASGDASPPGVFAGIADPVFVDLSTGEARSAIPIMVPPGRKGLTPSLHFRYGSRSAQGLLGRGWELGLATVRRSTRDGTPVDWDAAGLPYRDDAFILALPDRHIVLDSYLGAQGAGKLYGPSDEEYFVRALFEPASNRWTVTDKSGTQYIFGTTTNSRTGQNVTTSQQTFGWGVTQIKDPSSNTIDFGYAGYGASGNLNSYLYPSTIDYGGNLIYTAVGTPLHVCFSYATDASCATGGSTPTLRPDLREGWIGGYPQRPDYLITALKVWVDGETTATAPTYKYAFTYEQDTLSTDSRLKMVDLYDKDLVSLRPTTFNYASTTQSMSSFGQQLRFTTGYPRQLGPLRRNTIVTGTLSDLIDMNADGRLDWVECSQSLEATYLIYLNDGAGNFRPPQTWTIPTTGGVPEVCGFHTTYADLMDMNGDRLPDYVRTPIYSNPPGGAARDWYVAFNTGSGFTAAQTWPVYPGVYSMYPNPVGLQGGTSDLNGDGLPDIIDPGCNCPNNLGIPDYCSGEEGYCQIYLNTGSGHDAAPTLWHWPSIVGNPGARTWFDTGNGRTKLTLEDITGDGLPDLIDSRPAAPAPAGTWGVYVNTGVGFAFETRCVSGNIVGAVCVTDQQCSTGYQCADIPEYWLAPIDASSQPMDIAEACATNTNPPKGWPPTGLRSALRDMNGDGWLDYVDSNTAVTHSGEYIKCTNPTGGQDWKVWMNTGAGFAATPVTWSGTAGHLVQRWDEMLNNSVGGNKVSVVIGDTIDVNGDNLPEYVEATAADLYRINGRLANGLPNGLLTSQQNGLGAATSLTYKISTDSIAGSTSAAANLCTGGPNDGQVCTYTTDCPSGTCQECRDCHHSPNPLMVVSGVTATSSFTGIGNSLSKRYKYLAPYYDWQIKEFRGFRWGTEHFDQGGRRREVELTQPGFSPTDHPTWCGAPGQNCLLLALARKYKAKQKFVRIRAAGTSQVLKQHTFTWSFQITGGRAAVILTEETDTLHGSLGNPSTGLTLKHQYGYDAYNNLTSVKRFQNTEAAFKSRAVTSYQYDLTNWIIDRPSSVVMRDESDTRIAQTDLQYDTRGNLTRVSEWLNQDPLGGGARTVTRAILDYQGSDGAAGLPTQITDALGNISLIKYKTTVAGDGFSCDSRALYPCAVTNALSQTDRFNYRLSIGQVTSHIDANAAETRTAYDGFGRVLTVHRATAANQDPTSIPAWRRYAYSLGTSGTYSRVDTFTREPSSVSESRRMSTFVDSFGRVVEQKAESIVNGTPGTTVLQAFAFDDAGRPSTTYMPFAGSASLDTYDAPSGSVTTTTFDALDRATDVAPPDGTHIQTIYDPAGTIERRDPNYYACNGQPGTVLNATCPGKKAIEQRDALGRPIRLQQFAGTTLELDTVNTFDALDRIVTTQTGSNTASLVSFTYDSMNRRIAQTDKNSGTWQYGFDDANNRVYTNDPKTGQHIEWCYDALHRPIKQRSFTSDAWSGNSCTFGTLRTQYSYDSCTLGVGRLCQVSGIGRHNLLRGYDARGRVVDETRTVNAGGQQRSVAYLFSYDDADRLRTVRYPTSTDGTYETLTYGYDGVGGLISAATAANTYLSNAQYDRLGRNTVMALAGGAVEERRSYLGATGGFRLRDLGVWRGTTALQVWNYGVLSGSTVSNGYDKSGNLQRISDTSSAASAYAELTDRDNDWLYTYDGMGRLRGAKWGARPTTASFNYDTIGNLTSGNFAFPSISASTQIGFAQNSQRPNHVDSLTPSGTPTFSYEANVSNGDGNGGLVSRPTTVAGDTAKTIEYDIEHRVSRVTSGGNIVDYTYDDEGNLISRIVNSTSKTFYFGRFVEISGGQLTRHFFAGERRIAFSPVAASSSLTLAFADSAGVRQMLARLMDAGKPMTAAVVMLFVVFFSVVPVRAPHRVHRGRAAVVLLLYLITLPGFGGPSRTHFGEAEAQCPPTGPVPSYITHADHLGSTTLLTAYGIDGYSAGGVVEYYRYGPYGSAAVYDPSGAGIALGAARTNQLFNGMLYDAAVALYNYGQRYYDAAIGRFLSVDATGLGPNVYGFAATNPVNYIDRNGAFPMPSMVNPSVSIGSTPMAYGAPALSHAAIAVIGGVVAAGAIVMIASVGSSVIVTSALIGAISGAWVALSNGQDVLSGAVIGGGLGIFGGILGTAVLGSGIVAQTVGTGIGSGLAGALVAAGQSYQATGQVDFSQVVATGLFSFVAGSLGGGTSAYAASVGASELGGVLLGASLDAGFGALGSLGGGDFNNPPNSPGVGGAGPGGGAAGGGGGKGGGGGGSPASGSGSQDSGRDGVTLSDTNGPGGGGGKSPNPGGPPQSDILPIVVIPLGI